MTGATLRYFAEPGPTTNLAAYSDRIADLPSDPEALAEVVRGLLVHEGVVARCRLQFSAERRADRERVGASAILARVVGLDASPLSVERPVEDRMIGYCYHFAVLHCALLRAKGAPARTRCGFAAYYREGAWIDHWVVEYWNGADWVVIDPDSGRNVVSPAEFHNAALAWQLCRAGEADPLCHGNYTFWGWDELRGSLVNDLGALHKLEVGEWSWCDRIAIEDREQPSTELDAQLDDLARMVCDEAVAELRRAFLLDEGLQPPASLFEVAAS